MTAVRSAVLRLPIAGMARLAAIVALIAVAWIYGDAVLGALDASRPSGGLSREAVAAALLAYVVLMLVPFCPGVEVGLTLIVLVGPGIVPLVYLATVAALMLAFCVGRFIPTQTVIGLLGLFRLSRMRELLLRIEPMDAEQRLQFLMNAGRPRVRHWLLEHRYVALAIALNTPGNLVIGDGGGIALAAGFSRLFSARRFALTVMLAVSPIPVAVMIAA